MTIKILVHCPTELQLLPVALVTHNVRFLIRKNNSNTINILIENWLEVCGPGTENVYLIREEVCLVYSIVIIIDSH